MIDNKINNCAYFLLKIFMIIINLTLYFLKENILLYFSPLLNLGIENKYDITITVKGGGIVGQAEAIMRIKICKVSSLYILVSTL